MTKGLAMIGNSNKFMKMGLWGRLVQHFKLLFSLLQDYWKGEYREVSIGSVLLFFFAVVYIFSPIDVLSDYIPLIGQVDDAAVLLLCMYFLEKDLYKYREWKEAGMNGGNGG